MATSELEARLARLEAEVVRLREQVALLGQDSRPWWKKIQGTIPDDALSQQAERYGRQYRNSLKPKPKSKKGKPKRARTRHRSRHSAAAA